MEYLKLGVGLLIVGLLLMSGCGTESDSDAAYEKEMEDYAASYGVDVDVSNNSSGRNEVTLKNLGAPGSQIGSNLKLPDGFPSDVIVFPGTRIFSISPLPNGFVVSGQSEEKSAVIAEYVEREMEMLGWALAAPSEQSGLMQALRFSKSERVANISLVTTGETTSMQITTVRVGS